MWKNQLVVAYRSLIRTRAYSLINILCLTIGMASVLLIFLYGRHELTYDNSIEKQDRLYRVVYHSNPNRETYYSTISTNFADVVLPQLPGVVNYTRTRDNVVQVRVLDRTVAGEVTYMEPAFFDMFSVPVVAGKRNNFLTGTNDAVLTRSEAKHLFGDQNAVGQSIEVITTSGMYSFIVQGIVEDPPSNSSLQYRILIPFELKLSHMAGLFEDQWRTVYSNTYIELDFQTRVSDLITRLEAMDLGLEEQGGRAADQKNYRFQRLIDQHIMLSNPNHYPTSTDPQGLIVLGSIGVVILLLACVNFTMLALGQAGTRLREIGMRKVLGAVRRQLIVQMWIETALVAFVGTLFAIVSVELLLPMFRRLAGVNVAVDYDPLTFAALAFVYLLTVAVAGGYPAISISGFPVIASLKGAIRPQGKGQLRRMLVLGQMVVSVGLVATTLTMSAQLRFMHRKDLGYDGDQVVALNAKSSPGLADRALNILRSELAGDPGIVDMSMSTSTFGVAWDRISWNTEDEFKGVDIHTAEVDGHFLRTLGIELVSGRNFRLDDPNDLSNSVLVNEAFVRTFGWENPIGMSFPGKLPGVSVVGVVKDFHYNDLREEIGPVVLTGPGADFINASNWISMHAANCGYVLIRLAPDNIPATMEKIRHAWDSTINDQQFSATFLVESVDKQYREDYRWNRILSIATFFAVLIATLGLIGVSVLDVTKRAREIGIRKVLGATIPSILRLLMREVIFITLLANLLALPVAWYFQQQWLQNFAERITLAPLFLFMAGVAVLCIAVATVVLLSLKVALTNPVKSLRVE